MSSHPNGSVDSLSSIHDIYARYAAGTDSYSHSLDLATNEPGLAASPELGSPQISTFIPHIRTHDVPSAEVVRSAPGTPLLLLLFDFGLSVEPRGITSSSLNVLLDTPSGDSEYKQFPKVHHERLEDVGDDAYDQEYEEEIVNGEDEAEDNEDVIDDDEEDDLDENGHYVPPVEDDESIEEDDVELPENEVAERRNSGDFTVIRRTVKDFEFGKDLGEGSYSTVVLATDKHTNKQYAVKVLDKRHIIKEKKVKYVNIEKHALNRLNKCDGIISLFFTFQDKFSLYFVLDYASNGELLTLIKNYGTLNEECTRHLGAQILDAMKNMHDNGVVHRDIKPENILLDDNFRIKITDFGTAKLLEKRKTGDNAQEEYPVDVRAKSFVGTAEYVSPELLESKFCGKPGDIWAFGCILYQMVAGKPPFKATNEYLTFQKITKLQYAFSAGFPLILRDLIKQILVLQPSRRATISQIQDHYFFKDIDFLDPSLIWTAPLPELGPYKMTAKSMMKMPPQGKAQPTVIKRPTTAKKQTYDTPPRRIVSEENGKNFSPASVAAFVLTKRDDDESPSPISKVPSNNTNGSSRQAPAPEYIPGTNILRPTIHSMASYSRGNTQTRLESELKKQKPKVMEVAPMSQVELAWQGFLESLTERIIHLGLAIVCKQPVEYFEKKNRGLIHDAPLGLINKLQAADNRLSRRSLLSKVAHGNKGLRDISGEALAQKSYKEEDAITLFYEVPDSIESIPEDEEKTSTSSNAATAAKIGKGLFKKFLSHSDKKSEPLHDALSTVSTGSSSSRRQSMSLEKAKTCTILVTTHGRLLLLMREDQTNESKLVAEVRLNFPFIHFKEVISNLSKFSKMLPSTGIFAVVAKQSAFVFEVEKYEVSQWTEALAKAKLNQHERDRLEEAAKYKPSPKESPKTSPRQSPKPSPKLMDAPTFSNLGPKRREEVKPTSSSRKEASPSTSMQRRSGYNSPKSAQSPTLDPKDKHQNQLFHSKLRSGKSVKRKPPPPLPKLQSLSASGLSRELGRGGENGTVHAAQLAVSNNPNLVMTDTLRTSFSRDRENGHTAYRSSSSGGSGAGKAKITSMNSKFLARSRGKK